MSAPYIVPFNFQPASVSVKTGSYTIPSGKYARVTVNLEGNATFTIGGVTALRGTQNSVLGSSDITYQNGSSATKQMHVSTTTSTNDGNAFTSATDQKVTIAYYWLPTGTIINGTGTWRAVVEEYNMIS